MVDKRMLGSNSTGTERSHFLVAAGPTPLQRKLPPSSVCWSPLASSGSTAADGGVLWGLKAKGERRAPPHATVRLTAASRITNHIGLATPPLHHEARCPIRGKIAKSSATLRRTLRCPRLPCECSPLPEVACRSSQLHTRRHTRRAHREHHANRDHAGHRRRRRASSRHAHDVAAAHGRTGLARLGRCGDLGTGVGSRSPWPNLVCDGQRLVNLVGSLTLPQPRAGFRDRVD
jgi:hypothetical protein